MTMTRFVTWPSKVSALISPPDDFTLCYNYLHLFVVSERGVIFFRNQDLTIEDQKLLGQRLGELTGKPETSKVRIVLSYIA